MNPKERQPEPIRMPDKPYYRPDEIARLLEVSVKTIQRRIRQKKIVVDTKVGRLARISRNELVMRGGIR